jgi:hypothetical protein
MPHPLRLVERLKTSIETIKLIRTISSLFQERLLNEYKHLQAISYHINRYTICHKSICDAMQLLTPIQQRLVKLCRYLNEIQCLTIKCSIWLKNVSNNGSIKLIRIQLERYGKQYETLKNYVQQSIDTSNKRKDSFKWTERFRNELSIFQQTLRNNYDDQCQQMDLVERQSMVLFIESMSVFVSIVSSETHEQILTVNIERELCLWKKRNTCRIPWLPDEHQPIVESDDQTMKLVSSASSSSANVDIQIVEHNVDENSTDTRTTHAYESNWDWLLPSNKDNENLMVSSFNMAGMVCMCVFR